MNKKALKSNFSLLLAAAIWGVAFVAQSEAMNYIGAFAFTSIRYILGSLALIPVSVITLRSLKKQVGDEEVRKTVKRSFISGAVCGVVLFFASISQQIGLKYTAPGKAGFITAMYIVLVPVFGRIVFKSKTSVNTWISVALATGALYLLCVGESFSIAVGDLWVILCAFLFTVHILVIDKVSPGADSVTLSMVQFFVAGLVAIPFAIFIEDPVTASQIKAAGVSILYTGLLSTATAFTLQVVGQKSSGNPTVSALLMSMESVFAAIAGWLILHDTFSAKEFTGVILMASAIVLSQIPVGELRKKRNI